jgi:amino acid transporter
MSTKESLETLSPATATTASDKLNRSLSVWNSLTIGFAVVSPVVGLYAIIGVQTVVTGGGWFAALAISLVMQMLVATVYAELASQFPIAGGAYKWARQLGGATTGTYAGVIYVSSTIAMLTTTAYTGGIWLAIFFSSAGGGGSTLVMWGAVFLTICTLLNLAHVNVFKLVITLGVYAEMVGSVGVALLLFLFFPAAFIFRIVSAFGHRDCTQPDCRISGGARHCGLGLHWF